MKWRRVFIGLKFPLAGHSSICLYKGLSPQNPYVFIFGGWNGFEYSDKGFLMNPNTLETLVSYHRESKIKNATFFPSMNAISNYSSISSLKPSQMKSENNINYELSPPLLKK